MAIVRKRLGTMTVRQRRVISIAAVIEGLQSDSDVALYGGADVMEGQIHGGGEVDGKDGDNGKTEAGAGVAVVVVVTCVVVVT